MINSSLFSLEKGRTKIIHKINNDLLQIQLINDTMNVKISSKHDNMYYSDVNVDLKSSKKNELNA